MSLAIQQQLKMAAKDLESGNLLTAENACQQILEAIPEQPSALHLLGCVRLRTGKTEEALELLEKSMASESAFAEVYVHYAMALISSWTL